MKKINTTLLAALLLTTTSAIAADFNPQLNGVVLFELENDLNFKSDDPLGETNSTYLTVEPYLVMSLTDTLALESSLVFEPVASANPDENTLFDDEGLYAEELKATYNTDNFGVQLGKFNPSFGSAWDITPGVYGVDLAEDYETAEKLGGGAHYTFSTAHAGAYTLSGSVFKADDSFLSDSIIKGRGHTSRADGGMANNASFGSYTTTLDVENLADIEGLNANVGYRKQKAGSADVGNVNEKATVAGANYTWPVADKIEATALAEWVGINNVDGTADDARYITAGVSFIINDQWNVALTRSDRDLLVDAAPDTNDSISQVSAGYAFKNGFSIDAALAQVEDADVSTNVFGALAAYSYEF